MTGLKQSLPAACFGVAPVEDRSAIPAASIRFNSTAVFSIEDDAKKFIQACLVSLIPEWKLHVLSEDEAVEYFNEYRSDLVGSAGVGYHGTKAAALSVIGVRAFYRTILSFVFNSIPWLSATCSKDEMRLIVDGVVKKPRAFVASNLHDFFTGVILFYHFFDDLNAKRGWKSIIGINPFTEWSGLFDDLRSEQLALGLPDKWACADTSGSDKYQKHGLRMVFCELFTVEPAIRPLLEAYLSNLHVRYHVNQDGFVFLVSDGLDSGKWVTLFFNTLYTIVAILWILYSKGVPFEQCVRWPFRAGGDDGLVCWPFSDETFYQAWARIITPVTEQIVTNENGVEGSDVLPDTVPLVSAQLYSMGFHYDPGTNRVYPRTTRPNKALARLQVSTAREVRKDLIKQLILVHFWHDDLRALLEKELLDNNYCSFAEMQLWKIKCLKCYSVPQPECAPFRRTDGYKSYQYSEDEMSTTTTVTQTASGPDKAQKTVTTVVKKKPMKKVAPKKKGNAPIKAAKTLPQDSWFKACVDPEHNKAVPLPDNFGGLTATFRQKAQITLKATGPAQKDLVVIANQNPEAGLWVKTEFEPESESLKIKPALAHRRHSFLKKGGFAELLDTSDLPPALVRKIAVAAKLLWTRWVYSPKKKTKAMAAFSLGTQAFLTCGPVLLAHSPVDSYWQGLGKQETGFLSTSVEGFLSSSAPQIKPKVVDEFGQPVELAVSDGKFGLECVAGDHNFVFTVDRAGKYGVNLRDATGAVVASGSVDTNPTGGTAFSLTITGVPAGVLFPHFSPSTSNCNVLTFDWQAPIPDNDDDWYQIPTPDADVILGVTNGLRCTAQDLLCTYEGSTLNNEGSGVIAILPADFFQTHTVDDVTYKTLAELPMEFDGRSAEGFHAFMPPFGAAQSIFQQEDANPYDDTNIAAPRIAVVIKGANPDGVFRVKMNWHGEGPSVSQLFANRPRGGDPAAMAFCSQALANMNPCSANFIHLMIVSACLTAWRVAVNIAPTLEAVCKFGSAFASAYRTAFSDSSKKTKREDK